MAGWLGERRRWASATVAAVVLLAGMAAMSLATGCSSDPPSVENFGPVGEKDIPSNAPVSLTFHGSVVAPVAERAVRIDPSVDGSFSWRGNTLLFTPRTGWSRGTHYTVSVDRSGVNGFLLPLREPVSFDFMTAKELSVSTVQPADGTTEVAASNSIAVQFSYPIVPLGTSGGDPSPVKIEPELKGKGRWLTTSLYLFQPEKGLASGVKYSLAVPKGLSDTGGSSLAADFNWSFTTKAPSVAKVSPEDNTKFAGPRTEVRVSFDQPVDHPSAEQHFSLKGPDGAAVVGSFSWDQEVLVFRPQASLKLSTSYSAAMAAGVKAVAGQGETKPFGWSFTTVGTPKVASSSPAAGQATFPANDSIRINFTNPMDPDSVEKALTITPVNVPSGMSTPSQSHPGWQEGDTKLFIWGALKPSTRYTMTIGGDAQDKFGQKLGAPVTVGFTTAPLPPRVSLAVPGMVGSFNAATSPTLYVNHVNVSRLDFTLFRLDRAAFMKLSTDYKARESYTSDLANVVRVWSETPASADRNATALTSTSLTAEKGGKLSPGFYFVRIRTAENVSDGRLLVVSRLGLTMKRTDKQALVWATDLNSGEPAPDLPIRLVGVDGSDIASGKTDKDGVMVANNLPQTSPQKGPRQFFAFAEGDGDTGAVGSEWMEGINPYEFGLPWQPYSQPYKGFLYTDRPIYRPGQKVLFKGIVRADDDARYTLPPAGTEVVLDVRDSRGRQVQSSSVKLSDVGGFDGELLLSPDATLGFYRISAKIGEWSFGEGFSVAEYRKPEFEAKLSTDREAYVQGDQVAVAGSAAYYFGQPLANNPFTWRVTAQNYLFSLPEGGYQFVDSDLLREAGMQGDRLRTQGKGTVDAQGRFAFQFPADLSKDAMSQRFVVETTISDPNNQEVSSTTEAIVHKADRYVGLKPQQYVTRVGESATVDLLVVGTDGKPQPNVPVSVSFFSRKWNSVKERQPDGSYLWATKAEDTPLSTAGVTSDGEGKAKASVVAKEPGSVRVVAEVSDAKGNKMRSATYLYLSGSGFASWRMDSSDRVELVPDKKEYAVGDTARVLVPSPMENSLALVTVERGGLLSYKLMRLKGNSETLEFPISAEYAPNVYLSTVLFKGTGANGGVPGFKMGYGELKVSVADKKLNISVTPDKPRYEAGERASYTIKTTDSSGKGVPAELSLAVVDASVLALAEDNTRDPLDSFWGHRGLGITTAATLSQSVDRYNADLSRENKGAGGGGENPTVRREFPDTAFWDPKLRTNDAGEAKVELKLPDSLTTWRATAVGVTASTQVGTAKTDTIATKSLLLRPALPRFLLMGDHLTLATLLNNYTDREVEADVSLSAKGVQSEDGKQFGVQRVKVAPGAAQKVEWPARVDSVAGGDSNAVLTLTAKPITAGAPGDSVEMTLPVHTLTSAEAVATSGEVRDSTNEFVRVPDGANPVLGELTVETSPSLAAGMRYSARYLDEFPFECTEQTVSRFLPRVVMQRAFDKLNLPDREGIAGKLPGIVGRSLQKLYSGQSPDGGWGWWPGERSDQWISAYAVQGLSEARRAGYTVDPGVLDRAAQYLRRSLDAKYDAEHPENPNSRAYVLYALALVGNGDVGLTNSLYDRRATLGNYGRAFLALALRALGSTPQDGKVKSLLSDLSSAAIRSATGAHWEEATIDYRTMNSNTRSSAVVLDALVRLAPNSPLVPPAVRWLMVAREEGHWETTQETSMSLLALTDYLEASGELKGDFGYRVSLNGRDLATETVTPANVDEAKRLVVEVKDLVGGGDSLVNIARANPSGGQSGDGKLYYTMSLRYFLPGEKLPAVAEGIGLVREYYRLGDEAAGPVSKVAPGETVKVKLTLVALRDLHYLAVEDPLPSGLESVDTRLKTTSLAAADETGMVMKDGKEKSGPPWWRYDYFNQVEPRDDRVALFATYLPKGTYEYTYLARATSQGEFQALPARGYEMYFPEVWGRSEGSKFTVAP